MVHAPAMEKKFIEMVMVKRYPFMFNDFVIIGPKEDLVKSKSPIPQYRHSRKFIKKIIVFIEGDNSGTHYKEKQVWEKTDSFQRERMNGICQPAQAWVLQLIQLLQKMDIHSLIEQHGYPIKIKISLKFF